jgi:hypothetical protein
VIKTLQDDVTLDGLVGGVYSERIPRGASLPAIRVSDLAPQDVVTQNGTRVIVKGYFLVAVVDNVDTWAPLAPIADRIDEVLHRSAGVLAPIRVLQIWREEPYKQHEEDGDVTFRHLGGMYRVHAQKEA